MGNLEPNGKAVNFLPFTITRLNDVPSGATPGAFATWDEGAGEVIGYCVTRETLVRMFGHQRKWEFAASASGTYSHPSGPTTYPFSFSSSALSAYPGYLEPGPEVVVTGVPDERFLPHGRSKFGYFFDAAVIGSSLVSLDMRVALGQNVGGQMMEPANAIAPLAVPPRNMVIYDPSGYGGDAAPYVAYSDALDAFYLLLDILVSVAVQTTYPSPLFQETLSFVWRAGPVPAAGYPDSYEYPGTFVPVATSDGGTVEFSPLGTITGHYYYTPTLAPAWSFSMESIPPTTDGFFEFRLANGLTPARSSVDGQPLIHPVPLLPE